MKCNRPTIWMSRHEALSLRNVHTTTTFWQHKAYVSSNNWAFHLNPNSTIHPMNLNQFGWIPIDVRRLFQCAWMHTTSFLIVIHLHNTTFGSGLFISNVSLDNAVGVYEEHEKNDICFATWWPLMHAHAWRTYRSTVILFNTHVRMTNHRDDDDDNI